MNTSTRPDLLPILSIAEIYKIKQDFEARYACIPAAIRMSSLTQDILTKDFAIYPSTEPYHTIYGIPLISDESVPLNQFRIEWLKT